MDLSAVMVKCSVLAVVLSLYIGVFVPAVQAQAPAPGPAMMSDGQSIDQGIAFVLLFLALVLTYLIHPLEAFPSFF